MRRTRSRQVGRSVVSGATTPNRNGLVMLPDSSHMGDAAEATTRSADRGEYVGPVLHGHAMPSNNVSWIRHASTSESHRARGPARLNHRVVRCASTDSVRRYSMMPESPTGRLQTVQGAWLTSRTPSGVGPLQLGGQRR